MDPTVHSARIAGPTRPIRPGPRAGHGDAPPTEVDGASGDRVGSDRSGYAVQSTYAWIDQLLLFGMLEAPVTVHVADALG